MQLQSIIERIQRLGDLSMGFSREYLAQLKTWDCLLWTERQAYLAAISKAESACEEARMVLNGVRHRLEAEKPVATADVAGEVQQNGLPHS